jgi:hypothetical protein
MAPVWNAQVAIEYIAILAQQPSLSIPPLSRPSPAPAGVERGGKAVAPP